MPQDPDSHFRHRRRGVARSREEELTRQRERVSRLQDPVPDTARDAGGGSVGVLSVLEDDAPPPEVADSAEVDVAPGGEARRPRSIGAFRPELQGLRAVAILMVVCYHIWFDRVSGGVDIFLLISAFLLTGSFARKLESGRPLAVPHYWLHAFKRLVPPGALVIVLTITASLLVLSPTRWKDVLDEAVASLIYTENWLLASRSIDYYAADHSTASPLQHFWSLSIQGQVFVLWPALFLLTAVVVRRLRIPARPTLLVLFGAITALSLTWSVYSTATQQSFAYFDTRTRLWEFSLGSLLALALPSIERRLRFRQGSDPSRDGSRALRGVLGWTGLALILSCGWLINVQGAFPGWIALWPLLSACLVIIAGPTGLAWGADRLLSSRPMQWLGDISYALYLVHWPLLILALVSWDRTHLGPLTGTAVVAASILLAWMMTRWVDSPIRFSAALDRRWWRGALVIAVSAAAVMTPVVGIRLELESRDRHREAQGPADNPGAAVLAASGPTVPRGALPIPDPASLPDDWFWLTEPCTGTFEVPPSLAESCSRQGPADGAPVLVVVGDSRARQYAPALMSTALENGWTVVLLWASGCPLAQGDFLGEICQDRNSDIMGALLEQRPTAVALETTQVPWQGQEVTMEGTPQMASDLLAHGIDVIGLRDMPRLPENPTDCLGGPLSRPRCDLDVRQEYGDGSAMPDIPSPPTGPEVMPGQYYPVDLVPSICPGYRCELEIGNVYVWLDERHISASYSATLAPIADRQLTERGWDWTR